MSNVALIEALKKKFGTVKGSGEWLRIPCPTCAPNDQRKMKRYVPMWGYSSNCFICGRHVDIADLVDGYYIPSTANLKNIDFDAEKKPDPRALILPYSSATPINKLPESHPAIQFLYKDHLRDLDTYANVHKIVFVPYEGGMTFHNGKTFITSAERLIFPVYYNQKLVGWQMRSLPGTFYGDREDVIRYYHLFNKGSYLYNYDQAKGYDRVVVVEGVKKALKFPNGVATWGCGISRRQLKMLQSTWKEIIMMLDADTNPRSSTQKKAKEFVDGINSGGGSRAINIDLKKYGVDSPDELPANVLKLIADAEWEDQNGRHR